MAPRLVEQENNDEGGDNAVFLISFESTWITLGIRVGLHPGSIASYRKVRE